MSVPTTPVPFVSEGVNVIAADAAWLSVSRTMANCEASFTIAGVIDIVGKPMIVHVPMLVGCDSFPAVSFDVIESGCGPLASRLVVTL